MDSDFRIYDRIPHVCTINLYANFPYVYQYFWFFFTGAQYADANAAEQFVHPQIVKWNLLSVYLFSFHYFHNIYINEQFYSLQ